MDQTEIESILASLPPWATETTLESVSSSMFKQNVNMSSVAAALSKKDAAAIKEMVDEAKKSEQQSNKLGDASVKAAQMASGAMGKIMSSSQPANAVAELSHEAAKLLANAGIGLSNMGTGLGKWSTILKGISRHAGTPLVVGTGLGVLFAGMLTEQTKQAQKLISFGAVVSDTEHWNHLRQSTRDLGMGLKDFESVMQEAKAFTVQAEGNAFNGALKLAEFAKAVDADKTFRDYGMSLQDQTRFIAQEIETLFELGEITEFNNKTKERVIRSYASANKLAMFTGDIFGMQRDEALRLREEARNSVDLRVSIKQNAQHINDTFGEHASEYIEQAAGMVHPILTQLLGTDFANKIKAMHESFVGDIEFDQTAANDITGEMVKTLARSPDATPALIKLVEQMGTGKLTNEKEVLEAIKPLISAISDTAMSITTSDPNLEELNLIIANLTTAAGSEAFLQSDPDVMLSDYYANFADASDTSVEVINNLTIAFQNMQELLTPGFDTLSGGFTLLSDGMMTFGKAVSKAFNGGDDSRFKLNLKEFEDKRIEERLSKINEHNIDSNIQIVDMQVKTLEEQLKLNKELHESAENGGKTPEVIDPETGEVISGGEAFTEEDLFILKQQALQLRESIADTKDYLKKLTDLDLKLDAKKEATVVDG